MHKVFGPALAVASCIAAVFLLSPTACVTECGSDEDCAAPFFRCQQNVCVECLTADDCEVLFGERRMCFHGTCCSQNDRGCFEHEPLPNPRQCSVNLDCVYSVGFVIDDAGVGGCGSDADCPEPAVCDNPGIIRSGTFDTTPPFAREDGQCRYPAAPFCVVDKCGECRTGIDCAAIGRAACCCPNNGGGTQCVVPNDDGTCC